MACPFIPSIVSFQEQKFLILIKTNVWYFSFMSCTLGVLYKRSLLKSKSHRSSVFFQKFYFCQVFHLGLQTIVSTAVHVLWSIYIEVGFRVGFYLLIFFFAFWYPIAVASIIENTIFLLWIACAPSSKINWPCMYESISGLFSVPLIHLSILMPILHRLCCCAFMMQTPTSAVCVLWMRRTNSHGLH